MKSFEFFLGIFFFYSSLFLCFVCCLGLCFGWFVVRMREERKRKRKGKENNHGTKKLNSLKKKKPPCSVCMGFSYNDEP